MDPSSTTTAAADVDDKLELRKAKHAITQYNMTCPIKESDLFINLEEDICHHEPHDRDVQIENCLSINQHRFNDLRINLLSGKDYELTTEFTRGKPRLLGEGTYGAVLLARDRGTNNYVVLKFIKKEHGQIEDIINEYSMQRKASKILRAGCKTPNIVGIMKLSETSALNRYFNEYILVQEFCSSTPSSQFSMTVEEALEEHKRGKQIFSQKQWQHICLQLVSAAHQLNKGGIMHLDLKANNTLLQIRRNQLIVCVIDYGMAMGPKERVKRDTIFDKSCINQYYGIEMFIYPYPFKYSDMYLISNIIEIVAKSVMRNKGLEDEMRFYRAVFPAVRDSDEVLKLKIKALYKKSPQCVPSGDAVLKPKLAEECRVSADSQAITALINACSQLVESQYEKALMIAMFSIMFHANLRIGEITNSSYNLKIRQVSMKKENHIVIRFTSSRYCLNKPVTINMKADCDSSRKSICPVLLLNEYLTLRGDDCGHLFIDESARPIHPANFTSLLWSACRKASLTIRKITPLSYSLHDYNNGFASFSY